MMKNLERFSAPWLNKKIILVLSAVFTVLFFLFPKQHLLAQTSLTIGTAPASEKLTLQPGEKYEGEIVVWNLSEITTTYNIFVRGFRQIEDVV